MAHGVRCRMPGQVWSSSQIVALGSKAHTVASGLAGWVESSRESVARVCGYRSLQPSASIECVPHIQRALKAGARPSLPVACLPDGGASTSTGTSTSSGTFDGDRQWVSRCFPRIESTIIHA